MNDNLSENYKSVFELINKIDEDEKEILKARLENVHQRQRVNKMCPHEILLKSNAQSLHFYCLCCTQEIHYIKDESIVIDMDKPFDRTYLCSINNNYYNMIYNDTCKHMRNYLKEIIKVKLKIY